MVENTNGQHTSTHGWTIATLKDFLLNIIQQNDKRYEERDAANKEALKAALAAAEKAAEKTDVGLKEYKVSTNEWRDTVKDLVSRMPTLVFVDDKFKSLEEKLTLERRAKESVVEKLDDRIDALEESREGMRQRGMGVNQGWLLASGVVGLAILVAGFVIALFFQK